jgi:hypothetical protein
MGDGEPETIPVRLKAKRDDLSLHQLRFANEVEFFRGEFYRTPWMSPACTRCSVA